MTQITEQTLEGYKTEIEKFKTRSEAESFLNGLTVKELKALYKYLVMFTYGEWYRMRKAEFIEEIIEYYFEREIEESTEDTSEVTEETKAVLKNLNASCYELTDEMYKEIYEELNIYRVISRIKCEVAIERKDREMYSSGKEKYEKYASIMKGYFGVLEEYMNSEDREFSKRNALPEWPYEEQAEGNVVYQILSQKGNAKAQQELLKAQGEEYLLDMYLVFNAPVKYSMDTPAELRKYLCQAVLRVRRDKEYGMQLLNMKARNEMQTEDDIRNSKDTIERSRYEERQRRQREFYDYIEESIKLSA